jgi:parallel beta-helix repeat protein
VSRARRVSSAILGLAALACGAASVWSAVHLGHGASRASDIAATANDRVPASRPDNPRPKRNLIRMAPDQFDPAIKRQDLIGTQYHNVVVLPDRLEYLVGPRVAWSGAFRTLPRFDGRVSLGDVAGLLARSPYPDTFKQVSPGVFQLAAGLVQARGTRMEVTAPEVKELRLVSKPYVYLAGVGSQVLFRGVKVMSWLPAENRPDPDPNHRRPFVSYDDGSRFDIADSEFSYLGTDSSKAYGVSWGAGTGGEVTGSTFHHNLFGVYTGKAVGVAFRKNVIRDNAIYGFDPHSGSRNLTIVDNEAYGNNAHGIIFSDNVTNSVVERNRSHHNGQNGIMMDKQCNNNVIRANEVWDNRGDGIVLQGSSKSMVVDNKVTNNDVGLRVNANELGPAVDNQLLRNDVAANDLGLEVYGGARGTLSQENTYRQTKNQAMLFLEPGTSQKDSVVGGQKGLVAQNVEVTVRGLAMSGVERGVVANDGAKVTVEGSQIAAMDISVDVGNVGTVTVANGEGGTQSVLTGARKGVLVNGTVDLRGVAIREVERGVLVGPDGHATLDGTNITATNKGIEVLGVAGTGSGTGARAKSLDRVKLTASEVKAPEPVVGTEVAATGNNLSAVPSWLAIAGAIFVIIALFLHFGHRVYSPSSSVRHKAGPDEFEAERAAERAAERERVKVGSDA